MAKVSHSSPVLDDLLGQCDSLKTQIESMTQIASARETQFAAVRAERDALEEDCLVARKLLVERAQEITQLDGENAELKLFNAGLLEALKTITDHFSDVMRGMAHIRFQNGIEGIPTIARARAAIARAEGQTASPRKIKTTHIFPPIPDRSNDWCAYYEGTEEAGPYGWGPTEKAAIDDLKQNYEVEA